MLHFPKSWVGRAAWLSSAAAAIAACVLLVLTVKEAVPVLLSRKLAAQKPAPQVNSGFPEITTPSVAMAELAEAVRSANALSSAKCSELIDSWRGEFRDARSPARLRPFVSELTSLVQKMHHGADLLYGPSGNESVLSSFREIVVDERQLGADLQATVEGYERFLAEQDRQILRAAGISDAQQGLVQVRIPAYVQWNGALEPVVAYAVQEARRDMGRFAANWIASDEGGDQLRTMFRNAGVDGSKPGSWGDFFLDVVADVGVGVAVDSMTDPTEGLIKRLGEEMARAEQAIFEGDHGFVSELRRVKSFHEEARAQFLVRITQQ